MENITLELIKGIKDRFKYPIITIYVIVLILWNWDVLSYYVFSDSKIETKIDYIEKHFNQNWSRILYPLCKAILLAIVIPGIMLCIEYLVQKINNPRRVIKLKNNEAIRQEKLAIAIHEFKVEQERTGKRTIEEWEEKVKNLEHNLELKKVDNAILKKQKEDLDTINNGFLAEIDKKNSQIEKFNADIQEYNGSFKLIIQKITTNNEIQISQISELAQNIRYIDEENGLVQFKNEISDVNKLVLDRLIKLGILERENNKYYALLTGYPFLKYCKINFPASRLEQL